MVGYTLIGGFLAAVWTDLLQSVMMFIGVTILVVLALPAAGGLEKASRQAMQNVEQTALEQGATPRQPRRHGIAICVRAGPARRRHAVSAADDGVFVVLLLAVRGHGLPASVVRVMACKDTDVLRRSIFLLAVYNMGIYLPLIAICICARAMMPDLGKESDEVIPRMAPGADAGVAAAARGFRA